MLSQDEAARHVCCISHNGFLSVYTHTTQVSLFVCWGIGKFTCSCIVLIVFFFLLLLYSKTCLKWNLKGPEHFSAKARFPFNQGTLKIKPGHAHI